MGRQIGVPMMNLGFVSALAFSPDGSTLATGGSDRLIKFWQVDHQPSQRPTASPGDGMINAVAYGPDGRFFWTVTDRGVAQVWDGTTGAKAGPPLKHEGGAADLAFSPDGRLLAAKTESGYWIWDVARGHEVATIKRQQHDASIELAFRPDNRTVVYAAGK